MPETAGTNEAIFHSSNQGHPSGTAANAGHSSREQARKLEVLPIASLGLAPDHRYFWGATGVSQTVCGIVLLFVSCITLFGCGGGYPGASSLHVSTSANTIDAGQSISLRTDLPGGASSNWSLSGNNCPSGGCGTITSQGTTGIYTAPASVVAPIQVKITASINGSSTSSSATITVNPAISVTGTPTAGTVGVAYSYTLSSTGGTGAVKLSLASGTLPNGLSFNAATGVISGTPTAAGTSTFVLQATDNSDVPVTVSISESITIATTGSAGNALTVVSGNPPNGTVNTPYSSALAAVGGTQPYTWSILSGALPTGLSLAPATGVINGTPTVATTYSFTAQAQDSLGAKATGTFSITIDPVSILVVGTPPVGVVGTPYAGTIPVTGGTAPYTCVLKTGTLPANLTLNANCQITGTPTAAGSSTFGITVTDSSSPANSTTTSVTLTVNQSTVLTLISPPPATVGNPYSGVITVTGGTAPYTCSLASGTLPAGLTLTTNCTVTGTPTTAGSSTISVHVVDSTTPAIGTTGTVTIVVQAVPPLTFTGSLPNAVVGAAYTQTLSASGGVAPYTYAVTSGSLPAGLTLSSTGVVTGTPTAAGASSFTITATDSETTPQTAALPLVLSVTYPVSPYDAWLKGPYAYLFQGYDDVVLGVLAYQTASVGSFIADGAGLLTSGEQDSNHQSSNPASNTVQSLNLIGTYTLGSDGRGSITISTLNADGTVAGSTTYAVSVKVPTAPVTVSSRGSIIESDDASLVGTRGSGTFLAQTTASFTPGLTGSYAFGLSGDTPCLPTCTIGISAGPVAAVGQFTANGSGSISDGTGDTNIASTNYPSAPLTGSYTSADSHGRLHLSLSSTAITPSAYPSDYAVYIVDASHAFLMSSDKHSSYILLAGTATLQSQTNFTDSAMAGSYIGYENSASNPGLLGVVLQNVLNLSTASIFRATADGRGTCNTTNVDTAGVTGLLDGITGLVGGITGLNALLGTYQTTGNSTCPVSANGRTVLNYPAPDNILAGLLGMLGLATTPPAPRVAYLTSNSTGYFLETSYASLGHIEQQTITSFSLSTLKGSFVYGTAPAASLASINTSGVLTADGAGNATGTLDLNVGVGNINVIELDVPATYTYTLTDATAGRYLIAPSTVAYAISPGRFVLLDTDALSTSPSVALLY